MDLLLYGISSLGRYIARAVLVKPWIHVVGVVEATPPKLGNDLGEVIGLPRKTGVTFKRSTTSSQRCSPLNRPLTTRARGD